MSHFSTSLFATGVLCILLCSCGDSAVTGSGKLAKDTRTLMPFSAIQVNGHYDINIVAQKSPQVIVITDDNIVSKIVTEVKQDTLHVRTKSSQQLLPTKPVRLDIAMSELSKITISGENTVAITNLSSRALDVTAMGASKVSLAGKAEQMQIHTSGATELDAENLAAEIAKVDSNGSSQIKVHANRSLDVAISGSGRVDYTGHPQRVTQTVQGSGEVVSVE